MIVDKGTMRGVLGGLIIRPQLLSNIDKYTLSVLDFPVKFERLIFNAIEGLYRNGANSISSIDIDNYLSTDTTAKSIFDANGGIEYINDTIAFAQIDNFDYYYKKLKKYNLLRDLQKQGLDISKFYIEDITNPKYNEVNSKFESLEISEIINELKVNLLTTETKYVQNSNIQSWSVDEEIDNVINSFGSTESVGLSINGEIFSQIINGAELGALTIRSLASGVGKAIPDYTLLPTPCGYRHADELKIGDLLWGDDGNPTRIVNIYPQPELKEIYKVYFKDGRIAECCKEHLWGIITQSSYKIMDTQTIIHNGLKNSHGYKYSVPLNKAVQYPSKVLYPSPYAMGALLGDGSFRYDQTNKALTFSSQDEEIVRLTAQGLNSNYEKNNAKNYTWTFKLKELIHKRKNLWVEEALINYPELWNKKSIDKFIPDDYIYASIEQRKELLRGLLDTDGTIDTKGRVRYDTNSQTMANQVVELCRSLGYIATLHTDNHKNSSMIYYIVIQCTVDEKSSLFHLQRKKDRAVNNEQKNLRRERRDNNVIVNIEATGIYTSMRCFTVDNNSHLFLMNDYIVTHNTRMSVADACMLAYPFYYDTDKCKWSINGGHNEKVLFIMTEQTPQQILRMIVAYLTGIEESKLRFGKFTDEEANRIKIARRIINEYKDNFQLMRIPDPNVEQIKLLVRERVLMSNIKYVFMDYVFISPAILNEFKGHNIRNDEALLLMATALKDLAIELNVSVFTSTQVNAKVDENREIRNEASLAGGRSTINKADNGIIGARPTREELDALKELGTTKNIEPNLVLDIFKVRSGRWTQVRIWCDFNPGTLRLKTLFVTDSRLMAIKDFFTYQPAYSWENNEELIAKLVEYNAYNTNNTVENIQPVNIQNMIK